MIRTKLLVMITIKKRWKSKSSNEIIFQIFGKNFKPKIINVIEGEHRNYVLRCQILNNDINNISVINDGLTSIIAF